VIYGNNQAPEIISLAMPELLKAYNTGSFTSTLFDIDVDGKVQRVLPRDVQIHPVTDKPLHVDFLRLGADSLLSVAVPVHFSGQLESPGIKRGGVLNIVLHEITVRCPVNAIPEEIEISLAGRDIGESIQIGSIDLPAGVRTTIARNFTIATIAPPTVSRDAEAAAAPAAAGKAGKAPAKAAPAKAPAAAPKKK
jgi:large subunit ribosomal protein L25